MRDLLFYPTPINGTEKYIRVFPCKPPNLSADWYIRCSYFNKNIQLTIIIFGVL